MDEDSKIYDQSDLTGFIDGSKTSSKSKQPNEGISAKRINIVFRNSVPEIPTTTYGAFSVYKYPAKFIPQIVAYTLKKYAKPGAVVFDPFAGYGTVGVVSRVYGHPYELWDLNPILNLIHDTATMKTPRTSIAGLMRKIRDSEIEFTPKWKNLGYWFPDEFIPMISRAWGLVSTMEGTSKHMLTIPLLKTTRYFSYSDEKVHKLYKSKFSKRKMESLLKDDWENYFYGMLEKQVLTLVAKIKEHSHLNPQRVEYRIRSGINSLTASLENEVDILMTSPPYLQAQEYIRSTKLELFWLGYNEEEIKSLSRQELPYNAVDPIDIHSEKFRFYGDRIKEPHLKRLYDRYFHGIIGAFSNLGERVNDYMCIFVGPAKIRTTPIPIDEIIVEHLVELGWKHDVTYIDPIISRAMFASKVNPASGLEDSRMANEHLVILRRAR